MYKNFRTLRYSCGIGIFSMMRQAAELTFSDNESGEELVSNRTDKLSLGMMTEDIGGKLMILNNIGGTLII